jgi:hypothetical protein
LDTPEGLSLRLTRLEEAVKSGAAATPQVVVKTEEAPEAAATQEPHFDLEEPGAAVLQQPEAEVFAPPPVPEKPEAGDGGLWSRLSAELQRTMPPFISVRLKGAACRREGEGLVISVKSAPAKAALEKPEPQEIIRAAIEKVLGETLPFRLEVGAPSSGGGDLDALARFGNVKFD